jgi:hypothetical protein
MAIILVVETAEAALEEGMAEVVEDAEEYRDG